MIFCFGNVSIGPMPAPEAVQARITPAYHQDKGEAEEFLRAALVAREAAGYVDASTCPERLIFDFLWLDIGGYLADSQELTNPFVGNWTYMESKDKRWPDLMHVDIWSTAQFVQRQGVAAEMQLLEMAKRDKGRCVWPVSLLRYPVANVASSDAVRVLNEYPWADSGLSWEGTMVFKERSGDDRSALLAAASKPGQPPATGSLHAPPKAMPTASAKASAPEGKAASSGRPASDSAAVGSGDRAVSKASARRPRTQGLQHFLLQRHRVSNRKRLPDPRTQTTQR